MAEKFQVFVSYSRKDDIRAGGDPATAGFVSFLIDRLREQLADLGASEVELWMDSGNIAVAEGFASNLERVIATSSLMLVIMSPNWTQSAYCQREAQRFAEIWASKPEADARSRMLVVRKLPNDRTIWPSVLQGQAGIPFYSGDIGDATGLVSEFFWNGKVRNETYYRAVRDLAGVIAKRLHAVPSPLPPPIVVTELKADQPLGAYYVSYAWADESDKNRERKVDALCAAAEGRGVKIIRDKNAMRRGDSISKFMSAIGAGDRVYVFLSDKYLRSPFCLFELYEIWRNSRQDEEEFKRRVRMYCLENVAIFTPLDRYDWARYWAGEYTKLNDAVKGDPALLGERDHKRLRNMQEFAFQVSNILALFADTVQAGTFDEFLDHGFSDLAT